MVLRVGVGVGLLLVMREGVDSHEAVVAAPLGVPHGGGGEVGGGHHHWGLHALLPHLTAAALLWRGGGAQRVTHTAPYTYCTKPGNLKPFHETSK